MKRFLVFAGGYYYPSGGWLDFRHSFDTEEEADDYFSKIGLSFDWKHVVDLEKEIITNERP